MTILRFAPWPLSMLCLCASVSTAQSPGDSALKGIAAIDAQVHVTWDDRITMNGGITQEAAIRTLTDRFTLELRKLGIVVASTAPNNLMCEVTFLHLQTGLVAYSNRIDFSELATMTRTKELRLASVWAQSGVAIVGRDNLSEAIDNQGRSCAERFGNAWLSVNPRR